MAEVGNTRINAGAIEFALHHRYLDGGAAHTQGRGSRGGSRADQGICIQVVGKVGDKETELLRFDCFDNHPHYHYGPENKNERIFMDTTTAGNPIGWTVTQMRERLPAMLDRAGYSDVAGQLDADLVSRSIDELDASAREMAAKERDTVTHNKGTNFVEAGAIRFGLEMRDLGQDGGMAIHVLGNVSGEEIELLAFDCFRVNPHYHYGPRAKNERIFWDKTSVPDTLKWTLEQFSEGKLPAMVARAGYPGIVAEMDRDLIRDKVREIESKAAVMAARTG